jgi:hypothetical protein
MDSISNTTMDAINKTTMDAINDKLDGVALGDKTLATSSTQSPSESNTMTVTENDAAEASTQALDTSETEGPSKEVLTGPLFEVAPREIHNLVYLHLWATGPHPAGVYSHDGLQFGYVGTLENERLDTSTIASLVEASEIPEWLLTCKTFFREACEEFRRHGMVTIAWFDKYYPLVEGDPEEDTRISLSEAIDSGSDPRRRFRGPIDPLAVKELHAVPYDLMYGYPINPTFTICVAVNVMSYILLWCCV